MKPNSVKGFQDFSSDEAEKRAEIKKILIEIFEKYGFEPAETPVIEYEEFVKGENTSDEAVSDIFKLQDKGKRKLALRYEFTFQLKRLMKNKKLPYKRYQIGPVFRDEPATSNRFRQFTQCDVDIVGSTTKDEAEILALSSEILRNLKIQPMIFVNNRKLLNEILEENKVKEKDKENVLREIDKYDKIGEKQVKKNLKKYNAEKIIDCLKKGEKYFDKFDSYKEIISLIEYCRAYGFEIKFSPTIVRGLSYYNGNVFEIKTKTMKETITAGGSFMFEGVQCTGISFGLERLTKLAKIKSEKQRIMIVSIGQDRAAIKLAQKLRKNKKIVLLYYGKPSKSLQCCNSKNIDKVIFVGDKEVRAKKFKIKDLKSGKESVLKI